MVKIRHKIIFSFTFMKKILPILLWTATLFSSCATSKMKTSEVQPSEITEMLKFEPFSFISLIEKGNKSTFNDSLSVQTKRILSETLETFEKLRLVNVNNNTNDSLQTKEFEKDVIFLVSSAVSDKNIKNLTIPPQIISLLKENNKRFGLIIVQSGFTRVKNNFGGQVAKGIGLGILTLGMYVQSPIKSNSTIYAIIVDAKNNNIAFYNQSFLQNKEPIEKETIKRQLDAIFQGYFWKEKQY